MVLRWQVPGELAGTRADQLLVARVKRLSRTRAQELIKKGDFRTAEGPLKPASRLEEGAEVELWRIPPDEADESGPGPAALYDDDDLLVLDKPGDLAVHPSARYLHQTVTWWLRQRAGDGRIAHPCHRLDRETSGVLICAWHRRAEAAVKTAFAEGRVRKTYLAVVEGALRESGALSWPLGLQGERGLVRIKMVADPAGREALTHVAPLVVDEEAVRTLVACRPMTGRQHQIRVHLQLAGHPVVGDKLYAMGEEWFDRFTREGVPEDGGGLAHERQALHAARARVRLGEREHDLRAPFPAELAGLLPGARASLDEEGDALLDRAEAALDEVERSHRKGS